MPKIGKNIYKRKDGRWEGRYIKDRNLNGKIIYGSVYGKTCSEVKKKLASVTYSSSQEIPYTLTVNNVNKIFVDVVRQWLSVTSLKVKQSTLASYMNTLELHVIPSIGAYRIQNITTEDVSRFAKEKLERGRANRKGGLSPKTVRDMLTIIKSIMDFALSEKIISNRISISYPKHEQQVMRVLSRPEQLALEDVLKAEPNIYKVGILLCLYTGLRIGEICALRWQDISPEFDVLSVQQTLQRTKSFDGGENKTKILIGTPKSLHSVRDIPIPKFLSVYLRDNVKIHGNYFLSTKSASFTEPRTMQNHFAKIVETANIAGVNYHALRHTFATRCVEAGVDIKSLSEMLGHANVNITLNRYVHSSFEQKQRGMNKLEEYIGM